MLLLKWWYHLAIRWVSAECWHQQSGSVQPWPNGLQHHHLDPLCSQLSEAKFDSDHLVLATVKVSSMIKPLTNLIHFCSKCLLIYPSVFRSWGRYFGKGLVPFSSWHFSLPQLTLAKLNTFPGLPKLSVPLQPAKDLCKTYPRAGPHQ